jgi:4-hydroxy-tetrahydrodipicolinate reductase
MTFKLAIAGACGRMGRELARVVHETAGCELAGGLEVAGSPHVGADYGGLIGVGNSGVIISADADAVLADCDGIIDFTVAKATVALVERTARHKKIHIIGTTGIDAAGDEAIARAARQTTIVKAGNYSLGINILQGLVKKVASVLGEEFDIEILEMHHKHKIDAPSGTALMLGRAAAEGRQINLQEKSVRSRDGHTGARRAGDIGFATLRGGAVIGEHTVMFASDAERIELTHKAQSREMFARGAVRAALWAKNQKPGLYDMQDVLGLI